MANGAFRIHRPPWRPPKPWPYVVAGLIVGEGLISTALLGGSGLDPVALYTHAPGWVHVSQLNFVTGAVLGGAAGGALGLVVWGTLAVRSWLGHRRRSDETS